MSVLTAASVAVGVAGVGASIYGANQAAGAAKDAAAAGRDAAAQSSAAAATARADATRELSPYADRGVQASDALSRLLGLSSAPGGGAPSAVTRPTANGIRPDDANDWGAYWKQWEGTTHNNPTSPWNGIANGIRSQASAQGWTQEQTDAALGKAYKDFGGGGTVPQLSPEALAARNPTPAKTEGQQTADVGPATGLPTDAPQTGYTGVATNTNPNAQGYEQSAYGTMVHDAQATFEDSPWWSIANDEIKTAVDDLDGKYGASGLLLSGGATRARAEIAARLRGDAFDKHYASRTGNFADYTSGLDTIAGRGLTASSGIASGGQVYAQQVGDAAQSAANTSANASIAGANATQEGIGNGLGFAGWTLGQLSQPRAPVAATPIKTVAPQTINYTPTTLPALVGRFG